MWKHIAWGMPVGPEVGGAQAVARIAEDSGQRWSAGVRADAGVDGAAADAVAAQAVHTSKSGLSPRAERGDATAEAVAAAAAVAAAEEGQPRQAAGSSAQEFEVFQAAHAVSSSSVAAAEAGSAWASLPAAVAVHGHVPEVLGAMPSPGSVEEPPALLSLVGAQRTPEGGILREMSVRHTGGSLLAGVPSRSPARHERGPGNDEREASLRLAGQAEVAGDEQTYSSPAPSRPSREVMPCWTLGG